ncbi:MAG: prephenate dehydrogenase/arogenate dehydrogenase family protein [Thermodesulfobacteriota bacterium]
MTIDQTVSVYGYGRFGKLWADILAENFHVQVFSRRGLQPEEVSPGTTICDQRTIFDCDALFFCVAISSFEEVLKQSAPYCKKETVFFDTCSVKVFPAGWMKKYLPEESSIIATHPMFGPDSYRKTTRKLPMVMCNISTAPTIFADWNDYFTSRSMQVEVMTPEKHDETIAYSQGITHYIGRVLAELQLRPSSIDTHGYRHLLEIIEQTCNDSRQLFFDLLHFNPYTKQMLKSLNHSLDRISTDLAKNEKDMAAR